MLMVLLCHRQCSKPLTRLYNSPLHPPIKRYTWQFEISSQPPANKLCFVRKQFEGFSYCRPVEGLADGGGSIKDPAFVGAAP